MKIFAIIYNREPKSDSYHESDIICILVTSNGNIKTNIAASNIYYRNTYFKGVKCILEESVTNIKNIAESLSQKLKNSQS